MLHGGFDAEHFAKSAGNFFKPFVGGDIIGQTVMDVRNNKASFGGKKIYNPEDDDYIKVRDISDYLKQQFQPGILAYVDRLRRAAGGRSKSTVVQETVNEITGQKISEINIPISLRKKTKDIGEAISNARAIYDDARYKVEYKTGFIDPNLDKKFEEAEDKINKRIMELHDLYVSGISLGVPKREANDYIESMYVGKVKANSRLVHAIKNGSKVKLNKKGKIY